MICFSRKKHAFECMAIKNLNDFDITNLTPKLHAPNINFGQTIFKKDDPKEIFIAINEFIYNISSKVKDTSVACYWFEWLMKFESICLSKKNKCICERRSFAPVDDKYQIDVIWLIWEALILEASNKSNNIYKRIIDSLLNLYCIKYTPSIKKQRKYLVYYAISLFTDEINFNAPLTNNKELIEKITKNIDVIYKEVKKNELSPQTDYLFNNIEKSNTDKTISKLDTLNAFLDKKMSS